MSQPTRVGLTIGSTTRLNEFDFSKISVSLERDLAPAENPVNAYRDIKALLERMVTEFQGSDLGARGHQESKSAGNAKQTVPPRPQGSKLVTLQERLGPRLQDVEVVEGFDGLCIRPKRYLGEAWGQVNEVVRSLGGHWQKGNTPKDGSWRAPK